MVNVSVFAGSKLGNNPKFKKHAEEVAELLNKKKANIYFGGRASGLMGVVAKKARELGTKVAGFITDRDIFLERECDQAIRVTDTTEQQKRLNSAGDIAVALPGSGMTLAEMFSWLVDNYNKGTKKTLAVLNTDGYYNDLLKFFKRVQKEGMSDQAKPSRLMIANNPQELAKMID